MQVGQDFGDVFRKMGGVWGMSQALQDAYLDSGDKKRRIPAGDEDARRAFRAMRFSSRGLSVWGTFTAPGPSRPIVSGERWKRAMMAAHWPGASWCGGKLEVGDYTGRLQ